MSGAISIGTSGLTASQKQMDVISNNLANSNTLGFKSSSTFFASMLNQSLTNSEAVGQGVAVAAVTTQFSQGSLETTNSPTDLAIDGDGFFVVTNDGVPLYTRAGAFHVDNNGYLVDNNGYKVQGLSSGTTTDITGLNSTTTSPAEGSTTISIGANLKADADDLTEFNVAQSVYDGQGGTHDLNITFTKMDTNTWSVDALLDDALGTVTSAINGVKFDTTGALSGMYTGATASATPAIGTGATVGTIASTVIDRPGHLYKDATGIVLTKGAAGWTVTTTGGYTGATATQEASGLNEVLKVDLDGNASDEPDITFNLGATAGNLWVAGNTLTFDVNETDVATQDLTLNFTGAEVSTLTWCTKTTDILPNDTAASTLTSYASQSSIQSLYTDGCQSGSLKTLSINGDGVIDGVFTNGKITPLATLCLVSFQDPSGLRKIGNYFGKTTASGEATPNQPGTSGLGAIMSNSLETSNTDVAKEFVNMITAQRAYQASAKAITTSDQLLSVLMNIKQ